MTLNKHQQQAKTEADRVIPTLPEHLHHAMRQQQQRTLHILKATPDDNTRQQHLDLYRQTLQRQSDQHNP